VVKPQDSVPVSDSGTYTCTYHGCTLRFKTRLKLQKHKREAHRRRQPSQVTGHGHCSSSQAGPHKCGRINPRTGKPCNSTFRQPYDLTRHEETIHNNHKQKMQCPLCAGEKTFSRNDALTRHMHVVHPETSSQAGNGAEAEVEDKLAINRPIDTLPIITACDSLEKEHNDNITRIDGTAADADYSQPTCEHPTSICPLFVGTSPSAIPQDMIFPGKTFLMSHGLEEKKALDCADRYATPSPPIYDNIPMILESNQYPTAETEINDVHGIHGSVATVIGPQISSRFDITAPSTIDDSLLKQSKQWHFL
jgi:hypothetical protein